jgi:hypothetical protein
LGKAVVSGVDGITVFDALVMAGSRFHDPIEPMDLANMRANGAGSLIRGVCNFAQTGFRPTGKT